jgi:hypothetical protein
MMEISINTEIVDRCIARMNERFHDEDLEDSLMNIAKEAMDYAATDLETTLDEIMGNPERMGMVGVLASRWMCVQILTYREILAGGDAPSN